MKKTVTFFLCIVVMLCASCLLFAASSVEVAGLTLPLIAGAELLPSSASQSGVTHVITYSVDKPVADVVAFYQPYLLENGFTLIGGAEGDNFNASVKKADTMFTVRIFSANQKTLLQFIW